MNINTISTCKNCTLHLNQKPALNAYEKSDIIWLGLSAKLREGFLPLDENTLSGSIIKKAEEQLEGIKSYKTNLIKCVPLSPDMKLRYPTKKEMDLCYKNFLCELEVISPSVIVLLGQRVSNFVFEKAHITRCRLAGYSYSPARVGKYSFIAVHHPSYIGVYRRKDINCYIDGIVDAVWKGMP